jgi:hypothetical protein
MIVDSFAALASKLFELFEEGHKAGELKPLAGFFFQFDWVR